VNYEQSLDALQAMKHQVARLEELILGAPRPMIEIPSDVVQLKPSADRVWGGALLRVKRIRGQQVSGYLLTPHRGGNREAWYEARLCEVTGIGRVPYPECRWKFENWWRDDVPIRDVVPPLSGFVQMIRSEK
jgi:hypothetical protein